MGKLQAQSLGRNAGNFYAQTGREYPSLKGYSKAYRNAFACAFISTSVFSICKVA